MEFNAQIGVIQSGIPFAELGRVLVSGRKDSNDCEAPDSLTGCGREQPKGFFACTSALVMEVRPAAISEYHP